MLKNETLKAKETGDGEKVEPQSVYFSAKGAWIPSQVVEFMINELNENKFETLKRVYL